MPSSKAEYSVSNKSVGMLYSVSIIELASEYYPKSDHNIHNNYRNQILAD